MHGPKFSPLRSVPSASGGIARLVCARIRAAGLEVAPFLAGAGLKVAQVDDPNVRLEASAQTKLLRMAAEALQDDLLGFHLARDLELREAGLIYYVLASSSDLADALGNAERLGRLTNESVELRFRTDQATKIAVKYVGIDHPSDIQETEFWLFGLVRMCRQLTNSRLALRQLKVRHFRPATPPEFRSFLGCDVDFGTEADEIIFPGMVSHLPIIGADAHLNKLLIRYAEETLAHRTPQIGHLRLRVERAIAPLLPHGKATAPQIARQLGISSRTLARLLSGEGLTLSGILDQYRANLAAAYLKHGDLTISEIAWLLGYKELSSFTHAYKRRTGMTPRQMRISQAFA
jgi:AraC-like DNA-binding protein